MRILIVEDHADTATILEKLVRKHGHFCEIAPTIASALAAAAQDRFNIALIDLGLPDGNGAVLAPMFEPKGIKCIALTGDSLSAEQLGQASGFIAALVKPINFTDLTVLLTKVGASESPRG